MRRYSKRLDLLEQLNEALRRLGEKPRTDLEDTLTVSPPDPAQGNWCMKDRFTDEEIQALVERFQAGTPKGVLAKEYGISLSSVKRLLRKHGAKRTNQD
ncbi:helix-turn-helix domain-containing protein [Nonomuraea sp. NPDC050790]|uniref:helix-turn-helix domain-containing protein n=1 Tax=Nonomuraea sp. NPDC050790 TaxID=3364371 RepID=UPI0037A0AE01